MIELGTITPRDAPGVYESRRKILSLARSLGFGSLEAARLATITSELGRRILASCSEPTIEVRLTTGAGDASLELLFAGRGKAPSATLLSGFFDDVSPFDDGDGRVGVRGRAAPANRFSL